MDREELKQLFDTLQRYAGWLDRDRTSVMVRSAVQALGTAMDYGRRSLAATANTRYQHCAAAGAGNWRKMLRVGAVEIRRALSRSRDDLGSAPALKKHHDRLRDSRAFEPVIRFKASSLSFAASRAIRRLARSRRLRKPPIERRDQFLQFTNQLALNQRHQRPPYRGA